MEMTDMSNYDASTPGRNGYSLAHGTAIDFELWKPQSYEYKRQRDVALRQVRGGLLPLLTIRRYRGEVLRSGVQMRAETDGNLSALFVADAAAREYELGHEQNMSTIRRRAEKQLAKYLEALNVRLRAFVQKGGEQ